MAQAVEIPVVLKIADNLPEGFKVEATNGDKSAFVVHMSKEHFDAPLTPQQVIQIITQAGHHEARLISQRVIHKGMIADLAKPLSGITDGDSLLITGEVEVSKACLIM
eukprot:TRINITY_DN3611_c0_g1_i1.p1 TRINITY_DN3611_c0_g1~~TRINITY_DN3611_c0_g1_i1.p1  ORF type:complete len:108 (+),score=39.09 TRINITY_DN3611_c0_g1_i1:120-443(+)